MNLRRAVVLVAVGIAAAAVTAGAGLAASRRGVVAEGRATSAGDGERFEWVDVLVSADADVGAWQVEITGAGGRVAFVGVEGDGRGSEPPVYDAAALSGGERLVIGSIRVKAGEAEGPSSARPERRAPSPPERGEGGAGGKPAPEGVRVARVHVRASGRVEYLGVLVALGDVDGKRIEGTVELVRGEAGQP